MRSCAAVDRKRFLFRSPSLGGRQPSRQVRRQADSVASHNESHRVADDGGDPNGREILGLMWAIRRRSLETRLVVSATFQAGHASSILVTRSTRNGLVRRPFGQ
jgi:hypothetical protein